MIPGFPKIYSILLVLSIRVLTAGANVMDTIHLNDYVDGDNDCDVQIFYSDITSDKQGSGRHSTHPTTISRTILQKNFPSNWMDVNITGSAVRGRVGMCKISFLFPHILAESISNNFVLKKLRSIEACYSYDTRNVPR